MTKEQVIEQLRTIVKPYVQNQTAFENLQEDTHLLNDLKINSANLVDVILDVESAFDVEISDAMAENMLTVRDAVQVILELVGE